MTTTRITMSIDGKTTRKTIYKEKYEKTDR